MTQTQPWEGLIARMTGTYNVIRLEKWSYIYLFVFEIKKAKNYWILHTAFLRGNWLDNQRSWPRYPATTGLAAKWLTAEDSNDCRNSILSTCHYPVLSSTSDWSWREGKFASNNERLYPYLGRSGSAVVSRTSFRVETSGDVAKCRLFSLDHQAIAGVTLLKQDQRISRTD